MTITAYAWNSDTGQGIPYASVEVVDSNNIPSFEGTAADENGRFVLTSQLLDQGGYKIAVTSQGYLPTIVDVDMLKKDHGVMLDVATLDAAIVTPKKKVPTAWIIAGVAALGAILFLAAKKQKKKKVGAMDSQQWVNIALIVGVSVGVLFLVIKPILQKLGLWTDTSDAAAANQKAVDASLQQARDQGSKQNFTDSQYQGWANAFLTEWRDGNADPGALASIILNVRSLTDLLLLIKAFGTVKVSTNWLSTCAFLKINCPEFDLPAAVREALDTSEVSQLNSNLLNKGINYTF